MARANVDEVDVKPVDLGQKFLACPSFSTVARLLLASGTTVGITASTRRDRNSVASADSGKPIANSRTRVLPSAETSAEDVYSSLTWLSQRTITAPAPRGAREHPGRAPGQRRRDERMRRPHPYPAAGSAGSHDARSPPSTIPGDKTPLATRTERHRRERRSSRPLSPRGWPLAANAAPYLPDGRCPRRRRRQRRRVRRIMSCQIRVIRPPLIIALLGSLVLPMAVEWELVEVDGLVAGVAAAGPAVEEGLQEPDGLGEREAGRGHLGATARG